MLIFSRFSGGIGFRILVRAMLLGSKVGLLECYVVCEG